LCFLTFCVLSEMAKPPSQFFFSSFFNPEGWNGTSLNLASLTNFLSLREAIHAFSFLRTSNSFSRLSGRGLLCFLQGSIRLSFCHVHLGDYPHFFPVFLTLPHGTAWETFSPPLGDEAPSELKLVWIAEFMLTLPPPFRFLGLPPSSKSGITNRAFSPPLNRSSFF